MEPTMTPISPDEPFRFACSPGVPCFNACCRDVNQFLYPYDILRLKRHLGIDSSRFLKTYTAIRIGPESGLPIVSLKADPVNGLVCPFVTPEGCRVYADRPASCRTYPVARALARSRDTGELTEHFMLLREPHCRGFEQTPSRTVRDWIADQQIADYNRINDRMMAIIALKNRSAPGPLGMTSQFLFRLALYDLDAFRRRVFENGLLQEMPIAPAALAAAETDDSALLEIGEAFVKRELFGEREALSP